MKMTYLKSVFTILILTLFTVLGCSKDDTLTVDPLGNPLANSAVNLTETSFIAKWSRVYRAESYLLDVSENENFTSFVPGFSAKSIDDLNATVTGLTGSKTYYYRVRAVHGTEISGYSNTVTTETLGSGIEPTTPLKEKATTFFVGVAVNSFNLTGLYDATIKREFSSITAENEMKMQNIFTGPGTYNWVEVDKLLAYAALNNLNVHGHALVWHGAVPSWLTNYEGTDAAFELEVKNYITAVVTHCKGKVKSWDVVNESINDGGGMRNTIFKQRMGADYISKCFQWARAADPEVLLFYNDYNTSVDINKQNDVYALIDNLKTNNIPIDGLGMQMHINFESPTKAQLIADTNKAVQRNLKVHYSELDIRVNSKDSQLITTFTPERNVAQKLKCKEVVQVYNAIPAANKYAITMWGLKDNDSWIIDFFKRNDWPLLFDANFNVKKAHTGFLEGLD
jgi:endo-1,4-beta-xylanase